MISNHNASADDALRDVRNLPAAFVSAFNSGDATALDQLYYPDVGVVVPVPGNPLPPERRSAAHTYLLGLGVPMQATTKHIYVADDTALIITEWSIHGTTRNGDNVDLSGTAADVARRDQSGAWRYLIDNPHGTQ